MISKITTFIIGALVATSLSMQAQVSTPPGGGNQKSVVTQYIGSLAHVTIKYNSPDVTGPNGESRKGEIWGKLVPYGMSPNNFGTAKEIPWRAGANENTVIKFSHDVLVQGKPLAAGAYGFHLIPKENGPWTLIFSKNTTSWGSYFYDEAEDALRVEASPEKAPFQEWLTYEFIDRQPESATVALKWEELQLPFKVEVQDLSKLYLATIEKELRGSTGFNWQNWVQAANFAVQDGTDLEKAMTWADAAINAPFIGQANYTTLSTKAQVLMKMGKNEDAMATMQKAVKHPTATPFQIHGFGRQLISMGMNEKALEIFRYNYEKFEGAWPTEVGMARGYAAVGEYDKALTHAKKAHEQAPDQLNKDSMAQAVEKLKKKEDIN